MNKETIVAAKNRLPLPELMAKLGLGDKAKRSAKCPFHDDSKESFSVFKRDDGTWAWKCHAGCGSGDEIAFLENHRSLSIGDAIRDFLAMAGVETESGRSSRVEEEFDWDQCVERLSEEQRIQLAKWRGYSLEFVNWLQEQKFLGIYGPGCIAFPVQSPDGYVSACHYRRKDDGSWRYAPYGQKTQPLILGDPKTADSILMAESPWDLLAVLDKLGIHTAEGLAGAAGIATRGASNGKLIQDLCSNDAKIYALTQNDEAGRKWLNDVTLHAGCPVLNVVTPDPHKDINDWTRAGAGKEELWDALNSAKPFAVECTVLREHEDLQSDKDLNDEEPESVPFPTDALPPILADVVREVARYQRVPESLPAMIGLGLISAAIGAGLEVKSGPQRTTRGNLFLIASGESGSGKSQCFVLMAEALLHFQHALQEEWRTVTKPTLDAKLISIEAKLKRLRDGKSKSTSSTQNTPNVDLLAEQLAQKALLEQQKYVPQLIAQDVTVEQLVVLLHRNQETIFSVSPDARRVCQNLLGRYSSGRILEDAVYLAGYSGDYVQVDRKSGDSVTLKKPCISLLWLSQPDILETLLQEPSLAQSGFLARCLMAHTLSEPQPISSDVCSIDEVAMKRWNDLIDSLLHSYRNPSQ